MTADEVVDWPADAVEVGRIAGAWGVKGGLRVQPHAGEPEALLSSRRWYLRPPDGGPVARPGVPAAAVPPLLRVTGVRRQGDGVVATAQDVPDRNAAEALKGARVFVSRASFPSVAGDDEFYWVDLIGLDVVNRDGAALGRVTDLLATGPHSVLRIAAADAEGGERLIPFVAAYIDKVDLGGRRIEVDWALDY